MLVAGIVIYNPDESRLRSNIKSILPQVDKVILYLNSKIDFLIENEYLEKIDFIGSGKNEGIAKALNQIMSKADSYGAEWCLLLDQDSISPENIINCFENYKGLPRAAILVPDVYDSSHNEHKERNTGIEEVNVGITSGSYNKVSVWKELNGFREDFFIDFVDWEFFARVRVNGYKAYRIGDVLLDHQLGRLTYHKFLGFTIQTYNHNAFRKYYITRNTFIIHALYPKYKEFNHPALRTIKRALITILYEENKKEKIKAMQKGYHSYKQLMRSKK